ncbi:MAG: hypothetical protein ABIL74_02320, partial [candidate division WOR-3 bacterium]
DIITGVKSMINSILKLYSYSPENLNLFWVRFYFDERRNNIIGQSLDFTGFLIDRLASSGILNGEQNRTILTYDNI